MNRWVWGVVVVVVVAAAVGGAWWWQQSRQAPAAATAVPEPVVAAASATPPAAASAAEVRHPLEPASAATPAGAPVDLVSALTGLFGRQVVLTLFQTDGFAARVVATVDNLGRSHAPPRVWPLNPAAGRFTVERQGTGEVIGAANAARYAAHLRLIEAVDTRRLAALYRQHYAEFQLAYQELGYPRGYFNDRLVEVIDQLLATPQPAPPLGVHRPEIKGPLQPARPWVLYEFDDAALQSLAAGQHILLRLGPQQAVQVRAWLVELRRQVATAAPPR